MPNLLTNPNSVEFLVRRQRADGKIMHEFSQTADLRDWKSMPYFYAAADASRLFVMAMEDYVNTSGDVYFLRRHWESVKRAYAFTRAHDSDGDGIYENTEGTGWVESWPSGMPHQEIYLAALDQQSADAMSRLASMVKDAHSRRRRLRLRRRFASNSPASTTTPPPASTPSAAIPTASWTPTASIYPVVAWWTGRLELPHAGPMMTRWASPVITRARHGRYSPGGCPSPNTARGVRSPGTPT